MKQGCPLSIILFALGTIDVIRSIEEKAKKFDPDSKLLAYLYDIILIIAPEHMAEVLLEGRADAVLAASIFHFGTFTVGEVKKFLAKKDIAVRL